MTGSQWSRDGCRSLGSVDNPPKEVIKGGVASHGIFPSLVIGETKEEEEKKGWVQVYKFPILTHKSKSINP